MTKDVAIPAALTITGDRGSFTITPIMLVTFPAPLRELSLMIAAAVREHPELEVGMSTDHLGNFIIDWKPRL